MILSLVKSLIGKEIACLCDLIVENARPRSIIVSTYLDGGANGAVVAQRFYTPLVGGSNPSSPTISNFLFLGNLEATAVRASSKTTRSIDSLLTFRNSKTDIGYNAPFKYSGSKIRTLSDLQVGC